ncbi:cell division protein DedD [Marinomonas aquimarina]|uniref:Cell division protein DedD n=1 Tax=Marinomonas aquimarina TaxID=295068 RepID=A0A1A8TQZ1_9GAMM|nr:SPOR domain-containing protein [Marinomonas aquimarina]SBS35288.1 cell division protein DedD [Marinomonas aquimarina]
MMLDAKSKYRLIGAGLLIVSSAILLPLLLDGERPEELNVQISVPERPSFPEVAIAPVQPVAELEQQAALEDLDVNDIELIEIASEDESSRQAPQVTKAPEPVKAEPAPKPVAPKKDPVPVGDRWTLQVATFGKQDNATRTLKKLQEAGYPAYVMSTNSLYKVFVGPELKREASERMKDKVLKEFKLSGIVVKYSPNS